MRVQRSDSIEEILDNINLYSSELTGNEEENAFKSMDMLINKFSLRLNDPIVEQMYN